MRVCVCVKKSKNKKCGFFGLYKRTQFASHTQKDLHQQPFLELLSMATFFFEIQFSDEGKVKCITHKKNGQANKVTTCKPKTSSSSSPTKNKNKDTTTKKDNDKKKDDKKNKKGPMQTKKYIKKESKKQVKKEAATKKKAAGTTPPPASQPPRKKDRKVDDKYDYEAASDVDSDHPSDEEGLDSDASSKDSYLM